MSKRSFTDEELREAVRGSSCLAEVCERLRLYKCGASYIVLQRHIVMLNLDTGHWKKAKISCSRFNPRPLDEILVKNSDYKGGTSNLKQKLLKNNLLEYKCYWCGLTEWRGQELSLHLDHINGERYDNHIDNLRLLCPNCHSQTPTYAGKRHRTNFPNSCESCGAEIHHTSNLCKKCAGIKAQPTKISWPSLEELDRMLSESNYVQVGKKLGVSDNAVRKHIQRHKKI